MRVYQLSALSLCLVVVVLQGAPQANFGDSNSSQQDNSDSKETVGNKIFFGNSNVNNILLGAALGAGGALVTQEIINSQNNNQCNCGPSRRRRRQLQGQEEDQRIFGLFGGGGGCDCGPPASVEFGPDCKGRQEGNPYYGCGCTDNPAGGIFTFGRRKRQININNSNSGDDVNNRFLNFRCLDAALTGRNQNNQSGRLGTE